MLTKNIAHHPAVDIGKSFSVTERDPFAFVEGNCGSDALVPVLFEVCSNELTECITLAAEYTCLNSPFNKEVKIVWIGPGDLCRSLFQTKHSYYL